MWNSYIWQRATVPSIVELYFSPSHLPSVGCFGIGCWDLALPRLPLMYIRMKKVGGWRLAHSLSPVNADGCIYWRMGRVYVQCQWIFMCLKHICGGRLLWIWEQDFDSELCQGGVRGIGVWLRRMRIPIQLALWLKMSLSLSLGQEHEYTMHILLKWVGSPPFF